MNVETGMWTTSARNRGNFPNNFIVPSSTPGESRVWVEKNEPFWTYYGLK